MGSVTMPCQLVRTRRQTVCISCGSEGPKLYADLSARLYPAPGAWDYRRCPACGLLWLDPMPEAADLGRFYQEYLTHGAPDTSQVTNPSWLRRLYRRANLASLDGRFGYRRSRRPAAVLRTLPYLWAWRLPRMDVQVMYLSRREGGRVLDVGCGAGGTMVALRALGWQPEGIDFDPRAVAVARAQDLDVRLGSLHEQAYPDASFDAVVMSHVIEHVPDPAALLVECRRVLKPGGQLVVLTPNAASFGHRKYRGRWLYLDPPRHLHIFSPRALRQLAAPLWGRRVRVFTTCRGAAWMTIGSRGLRRDLGWTTQRPASSLAKVAAEAWEFWEWLRMRFDPDGGEEIVLRVAGNE